MPGFRIEGNVSGNTVEVDANNNLRVRTPGYDATGLAVGGGEQNAGSAVMLADVDSGLIMGLREVISPEIDKDHRLRIAADNMVDQEDFTTASAQNTGKHTFTFTTLAATIAASNGIVTNSNSVTTTGIGLTFGTHAMFPVGGTQTTVCETSAAFSAQPNANTVVDFGLFLRGASAAFAPGDGMYFRMTSAGMFGVINNNGVETASAVFPLANGAGTFVYVNNATNRFLIQANNVSVTFWVNNTKVGEIFTPVGSHYPCQAKALPWSFRHAIVGGAAGAVLQATFKDYRILVRGPAYADRLSIVGTRVLGSYQGLTGGTMGSLATLPNNTNPTAAVPTGTALTANLPAGLGGQGSVTAQVSGAADNIWGSYQVPAGTALIQGRRLVIRGAVIDAVNIGAAVATTATLVQLSLAFGHTAVSLATAETASMATATTKAPRRVALGFMAWAVGAGIGAGPQSGQIVADFGDSPVFVNPGEFVALVGKFVVGTATASQVITFTWQPLFGWE